MDFHLYKLFGYPRGSVYFISEYLIVLTVSPYVPLFTVHFPEPWSSSFLTQTGKLGKTITAKTARSITSVVGK